MTISAVIFDFDETLAVPARSREAVLAESTEAVGAPDLSREAYLEAHAKHLDSESRTPIFAEMLPEDSDTDPEELADAYRQKVAESLRPVEGVPGLLADLREEYALGLLTNGPSKAQWSKLDQFDWIDRFDATAITGDLEAGKPDVRAFEAVLDDLGVDPDEAVYVGDDPEADVEGARNAGLYAVQVLYEGSPDRHPDANAYVERDSLAADLPGIVRDL
ncbi:HAD family hydrolase [Halorussus sp. MSC15.2]|uniref:HAD family hydrolase n=1 Tax=Halorussus sp. MSC15.2 TaxID=2283638 RepID=UPI0013D755E1|nr:HAD family hydrolase [Halorussus sp. MSC15.2]NEU55846.1 HAD family hydrolase [Halorussus sp. MSC15.2]